MPSDTSSTAPPLDVAQLLGRLLLVAVYPVSRYYKAIAIDRTATCFDSLGAPMPGIAVWVTVVAEILLPLLIIIGVKTRWRRSR